MTAVMMVVVRVLIHEHGGGVAIDPTHVLRHRVGGSSRWVRGNRRRP